MSRLAARLRAWSKPGPSAKPVAANDALIARYLRSGRLPWSEGYWQYRLQYTAEALQDAALMQRFRAGQPLPAGYGQRLDERVVEYPWVLARLTEGSGPILDAGAVLSYRYLLDLPQLATRPVVVCTLTMDSEYVARPNVSYLLGDLRHTPLRAAAAQAIVCISTLEHIGLDSTQVYAAAPRYREQRPDSYRAVIEEFKRLLAPGGRLYLTIPFGQYRNHGWLQQFDWAMVQDLISVFGGRLEALAFYRYAAAGWQVAEATECAAVRYFDIHETKSFDPDYAAAARAVACLALQA
jgi:hypothetical protein